MELTSNVERDRDHDQLDAVDGSGGVARHINGGGREDCVQRVAPIPASIVQAVCRIQASLEAVKKSARNPHGGYAYASADDVYACLTRRMGEVGLMILPLEAESEIVRVEKDGKTVQWLKVVYEFVLATADATWSDPRSKRSLFIQITGPQSHQASASYAEKAFLRSLFKIPSGDMDLDSMPQGDTEEDQIDMARPRKAKSSSSAKKDGTDVVFNELRGAISGADGPADLANIKKQSFATWQSMPDRWRQILDEEFEDKMREFEAV